MLRVVNDLRKKHHYEFKCRTQFVEYIFVQKALI